MRKTIIALPVVLISTLTENFVLSAKLRGTLVKPSSSEDSSAVLVVQDDVTNAQEDEFEEAFKRKADIDGKYLKHRDLKENHDWFIKPASTPQDRAVRLLYSKALHDTHVPGGGRWVLKKPRWVRDANVPAGGRWAMSTLAHHEPEESDSKPESLDPETWNFDDLWDEALTISMSRESNDVIDVVATVNTDAGEEREFEFDEEADLDETEDMLSSPFSAGQESGFDIEKDEREREARRESMRASLEELSALSPPNFELKKDKKEDKKAFEEENSLRSVKQSSHHRNHHRRHHTKHSSEEAPHRVHRHNPHRH